MKHLSRFDIEAIADKYVQAYMALPDVRNTQIYRIDPELLLEKVLGLNVEYQHLSYDGSILGMTSFTEMGVQVFEDDDNEAFFFLDGKTVLVEKDLNFDSKLKGRKNFTLMHEGSHQIFKMLFPNDYGVTQKSAGVHYYKANSERNKPIQHILKVSRTTVYELLKSKKFHSVRVGGQYRISKKSFENWLNGEKGGSEDGIC